MSRAAAEQLLKEAADHRGCEQEHALAVHPEQIIGRLGVDVWITVRAFRRSPGFRRTRCRREPENPARGAGQRLLADAQRGQKGSIDAATIWPAVASSD